MKSFDLSLNSSNGVGKVYAKVNDVYLSGTVYAFIRGGDWSNGALAGAFALRLRHGSSFSNMYRGFRCSYEP